jgi:protein SCO1/2
MVGCGEEESDGPITVESVNAPQIESLEDGANPDIPGSPLDENIAKFPDTGLVNQFGESVSFQTLPKKPIMISFIYTRCPDGDMCPLITQKMRRIQKKLSTDSVNFVSVTFDPEYDTPAVLRDYGDERGIDYDNWDFWTGDPEVIDQLVERFGIHSKKMDDQIVHNMRTYLVDEDQTVRYWYRSSDWNVDDLVDRLKSL